MKRPQISQQLVESGRGVDFGPKCLAAIISRLICKNAPKGGMLTDLRFVIGG